MRRRDSSFQRKNFYYVGKNKLHGVDCVLYDETGHIFIENETKRPTVNAKTLADALALDKDLAIMATAIVQHYRNIRDALEEKTKWKPDGLPIYPIILTLEDWFTFSPHVDEMLKKHIRQMLPKAKIPKRVLDEMPYTVASAHEFELAIQVIAQLNIYQSSAEDCWRPTNVVPLAVFMGEFKEQMISVNQSLFANDWERLIPQCPMGRP